MDNTTTTMDTTPVATTETSEAAPAISAPSPAVTTSQRPTSMQQALEQAAATDSASKEPAATAQAEPSAPTHATAEKKGPIPFEVHETSLKNAREKTRTEVLAEVDRDIGWARQVPRESMEHMSNIAQRMTRDPIGFLETFEAELRNHPDYGPQLVSRAGRQLAASRGTAAPAPPAPDVEIHDANGQVVGKTYSDTALTARDAWMKAQLLAEIGREFGPIKQAHEERQAAEQKAFETQQQQAAEVDRTIADVQELVNGDDALIGKVAEAITAHPDWSVRKAALHVRDTEMTAKLAGKAEQSVVDRFKHKAAGTTANGAGATATPTKPRDKESLRAYLETLAP